VLVGDSRRDGRDRHMIFHRPPKRMLIGNFDSC
jgi:hypothetical protein